MTAEYRVVDVGEFLTVGLVEYDLTGEPADISFEGILDSSQLSDLREHIDAIKKSLDKPVISMRSIL